LAGIGYKFGWNSSDQVWDKTLSMSKSEWVNDFDIYIYQMARTLHPKEIWENENLWFNQNHN
jgi:hypothetical protein